MDPGSLTLGSYPQNGFFAPTASLEWLRFGHGNAENPYACETQA
jgi:hypothetical protein